MKPAEPESVGAEEISVFHQFVAGKSGNGPGGLVSRRGAIFGVMEARRVGGHMPRAGRLTAARIPAPRRARTAIRPIAPVNSSISKSSDEDYGASLPLRDS